MQPATGLGELGSVSCGGVHVALKPRTLMAVTPPAVEHSCIGRRKDTGLFEGNPRGRRSKTTERHGTKLARALEWRARRS